MSGRAVRVWAALVVAICLAAGCASGDDGPDVEESADTTSDGSGSVSTSDCIVVDMAVSSEKIDLLSDLAAQFSGSAEAEVDGRCVEVRPQQVASGAAASALVRGWDEATDGPRPVVWSPASSTWGAVVNQRLSEAGEEPLVGEGSPFMLTPLVIAMPRPMAEALGWPDEPLGWSDVLNLARSGRGWEEFGHPEWGEFRLGKTNPNFSTSGLSALVAQSYAATGTTSGLSLENVARPEVVDFARTVESAVVHYGDTTLTFLENWARADRRGTALLYASAAAVEEKSVLDYNRGNPDGVLEPGESPVEPRVPLVAIYPEEGTVFSDNPLFVLDAEWVDTEQRAGAEAFADFVLLPENQELVLDAGFRPGNPSVPVTDPITADNGVDPDEPRTLLEIPEPPVVVALLDQWDEVRKEARVLIVLDVSGSMGDPAEAGGVDTKLDLARAALARALDQFKESDLVGLRVFSTDLDADGATFLDPVPIGPIGAQRDDLVGALDALFPFSLTPLYDVARTSFDEMVASYDPERINAVVLLSDGRNEDIDPADDAEQLDELLATLTRTTQGEGATPVRVFPIAYGADADLNVLREVAEAANAAVYDASDPRSIDKVFASVISNF
ncbi:MAG: substrate-binding and VWA domain-containing protein [Actinomycetota bacterium]|nr:substrate-binding and VWA domain-containing protein [Actinomycetota bacterium]